MARESVHLWIKVDSVGHALIVRYAEEYGRKRSVVCVLNRVCHFLIFQLFLRGKRCEFFLVLALWNFKLFLYKFAAK